MRHLSENVIHKSPPKSEFIVPNVLQKNNRTIFLVCTDAHTDANGVYITILWKRTFSTSCIASSDRREILSLGGALGTQYFEQMHAHSLPWSDTADCSRSAFTSQPLMWKVASGPGSLMPAQLLNSPVPHVLSSLLLLLLTKQGVPLIGGN